MVNEVNPNDKKEVAQKVDESKTASTEEQKSEVEGGSKDEITSTKELEVLAPNVKYVGKRMVHGKEVPSEPSQDPRAPGKIFKGLPSAEQQKKGFYYEEAAELCRAFPGLYKRIVKKGE